MNELKVSRVVALTFGVLVISLIAYIFVGTAIAEGRYHIAVGELIIIYIGQIAFMFVCSRGSRLNARRVVVSIVVPTAISLTFAAIAWYPSASVRLDTAAERGNIRRVTRILDAATIHADREFRRSESQRSDLNLSDLERAFTSAIEAREIEIAELLDAHGVNLTEWGSGMHPLTIAVRDSSPELFQTLITMGADPAREAFQLLWAALPNNPQGLQLALDAGADPNTLIGSPVGTPLHELVVYLDKYDGPPQEPGVWSSFELLIDAGADINRLDGYGHTPYLRTERNWLQERLVAFGAEPIKIDAPFTAATALHRAVRANTIDDVRRVLAEQPILLNIGARLGDRPLHYAVDNQQPSLEIVELLLEAGADPNAVNSRGWAPLVLLDWGADNVTPVLRLLVDHGADVNFTAYGASLLVMAIRTGNREAVALLLDTGAHIIPEAQQAAELSDDPEIIALIRRTDKK